MDKKIIHKFRLLGLSLRKDALIAIKEIIQQTDKVDDTLNIVSSNIAKLCTRGSIVEEYQVRQVMNGYEGNEWNCKEEVFGVYNAFTTPLLRYEGSTRQYSLQESNTTFLFESSYRSSIPSEVLQL